MCLCVFACVYVYLRFPGRAGGSSGLHWRCHWSRDISGMMHTFVLAWRREAMAWFCLMPLVAS